MLVGTMSPREVMPVQGPPGRLTLQSGAYQQLWSQLHPSQTQQSPGERSP